MKLTLEEMDKRVNLNKHSLNLLKYEINDKSISIVCRYLTRNSKITKHNIQCNNIGLKGAKFLATNTTITALNCRNNNIGLAGVKALTATTTLTSLIISLNNIGADGAKALTTNTIKDRFESYRQGIWSSCSLQQR